MLSYWVLRQYTVQLSAKLPGPWDYSHPFRRDLVDDLVLQYTVQLSERPPGPWDYSHPFRHDLELNVISVKNGNNHFPVIPSVFLLPPRPSFATQLLEPLNRPGDFGTIHEFSLGGNPHEGKGGKPFNNSLFSPLPPHSSHRPTAVRTEPILPNEESEIISRSRAVNLHVGIRRKTLPNKPFHEHVFSINE